MSSASVQVHPRFNVGGHEREECSDHTTAMTTTSEKTSEAENKKLRTDLQRITKNGSTPPPPPKAPEGTHHCDKRLLYDVDGFADLKRPRLVAVCSIGWHGFRARSSTPGEGVERCGVQALRARKAVEDCGCLVHQSGKKASSSWKQTTTWSTTCEQIRHSRPPEFERWT